MTYLRFVSSTLKVPEHPSTPVPVGLLACQRDPLLKNIKTHIVSACVSQQAHNAQNGKKGKKAVLAPTLPSGPIIEIVLHDTVIFPEGGGQPTDTGIITTGDGRVWPVVQCKRHGGVAVHYISIQDRDIDTALLALAEGSLVTASLDIKGFERRYDHMSLHTSQHLLSALLETRLNIPTLSWSLTASPSPCYVEIPRNMSAEEICHIQKEANKLVVEGRGVHVEVEELAPENENDTRLLESGRSVGKALPEDYTGGVKRTVVIEGVDRNPCCGTHLPTINNLQLFLLPHTEALSRSSTTSARLYFFSGPRLINYLTSSHNLLTNAASTLSCGLPLVPDRVIQTLQERKRAEKRVSDLENEVARAVVIDLKRELDKSDSNGLIKHLHRIDDSESPLTLLSMISLIFADMCTLGNKPYLIILTSSPSVQTVASATVVLVSGTEQATVKALGEKLKINLKMKGGGQGSRWSGKFIGVWKEDKQGITVGDSIAEVEFPRDCD